MLATQHHSYYVKWDDLIESEYLTVLLYTKAKIVSYVDDTSLYMSDHNIYNLLMEHRQEKIGQHFDETCTKFLGMQLDGNTYILSVRLSGIFIPNK